MKKSILTMALCLFLIFLNIEVNAQQDFLITLKMPPPGTLNVSDFWNITVTNNSGSDLSGYLVGTAKEYKDGMIAKGTTVPILFKKGINIIKIKDLPNTPDVEYIASDPRYKESLIRQGKFPSGKYEICVKLISASTNEELGSDCINQEVIETGMLTLTSPVDGENIDLNTQVLFTWSSGGKAPDDGYTLKICEVMKSQTPETAMKSNKSFFEQKGINSTKFSYPNSAKGFEEGNEYVWGVSSGNSESEVWKFSFGGKSPMIGYVDSEEDTSRFEVFYNELYNTLRVIKTNENNLTQKELNNLTDKINLDSLSEKEIEMVLIEFFKLNATDLETVLERTRMINFNKQNSNNDSRDKHYEEEQVKVFCQELNLKSMKEYGVPFHLALLRKQEEKLLDVYKKYFTNNDSNLVKYKNSCTEAYYPYYRGGSFPWKLTQSTTCNNRFRIIDYGCNYNLTSFSGTIRNWVTTKAIIIAMIYANAWGGNLAANNNSFFIKYWVCIPYGLTPFHLMTYLWARKY